MSFENYKDSLERKYLEQFRYEGDVACMDSIYNDIMQNTFDVEDYMTYQGCHVTRVPTCESHDNIYEVDYLGEHYHLNIMTTGDANRRLNHLQNLNGGQG